MYLKYKVVWHVSGKLRTDTGLVYVNTNTDDDDEKFAMAMRKILKEFDEIESVSLDIFAPDGCIEVSEEALNAMQENITW